MIRRLLPIMLGIIVTCLTNSATNEFTEIQAVGDVRFEHGLLRFWDANGDGYRARDIDCSVMEGTVVLPGADLRDEEPKVPMQQRTFDPNYIGGSLR